MQVQVSVQHQFASIRNGYTSLTGLAACGGVDSGRATKDAGCFSQKTVARSNGGGSDGGWSHLDWLWRHLAFEAAELEYLRWNPGISISA